MHRIDGPGATVDNRFTDGDPVGGVQATMVTDDWANDVQEELISILAAASITPMKGAQSQVLAAIQALLTAVLPKRVFATNDFIRIPDVPGGLILQFGAASSSAAGSVTVTFPLAFPNACRAVVVSPNGGNSGVALIAGGNMNINQNNFTLSAYDAAGARSAAACVYIAIGN